MSSTKKGILVPYETYSRLVHNMTNDTVSVRKEASTQKYGQQGLGTGQTPQPPPGIPDSTTNVRDLAQGKIQKRQHSGADEVVKKKNKKRHNGWKELWENL